MEGVMKIPMRLLAISFLGIACAVPFAGFAEEPVKHVPRQAAPSAPLSKPVVVGTPVKSMATSLSLRPTKPPVATAVTPKLPTAPSGTKRGIIFVGGKPGDAKGSLNPQPIPPGHPVPVDPIH
jgi:hypothetical protein